jgi:hypothetical protein
MDFWEVFFLLLIYIPAVMIWAYALVDIFRRDDMSGWMKALWVVIVFVIPFFGTLIYVLSRPPGATREERLAIDRASRDFVQRYETPDHASQLRTLAELHDRGKLSDEEFAAEKALVMRSQPGQAGGPSQVVPA